MCMVAGLDWRQQNLGRPAGNRPPPGHLRHPSGARGSLGYPVAGRLAPHAPKSRGTLELPFPWVWKRIIRNALAERSRQEKSIRIKLSQPETTGDFFYV